jgi:hypothetical protein
LKPVTKKAGPAFDGAGENLLDWVGCERSGGVNFWIGKIQRRIQAVKLEAGCYFRKLIRPHVIQ